MWVPRLRPATVGHSHTPAPAQECCGSCTLVVGGGRYPPTKGSRTGLGSKKEPMDTGEGRMGPVTLTGSEGRHGKRG